MNLWPKRASLPRTVPLRHDFVVGPQRHSELLLRPARLYYCIRCKWSFLVGANTIVVLDEDENPLAGEESIRRFKTFAQGPCPSLEAFVSTALSDADAARARSRRKRDEPGSPAPSHFSACSARPRSVLRVLTRARGDSGR
ncbi:MAG TPA: hypothetical protein VNE82_16470 [Candidatus Binataceae bacterium]|nr:hypothetical protein [Candidatus Binataceae bacterium]